MAFSSKYLLCGIEGQTLGKKKILSSVDLVSFVMKIVDKKVGKEEYPPSEFDPTRIDKISGDLVSLIHLVIPNGAEVPHSV